MLVGSVQLTSSTWWGFSSCRTAPSTWLRILSVALEEELKILDFVEWLKYYYFVLLDCFLSAFSHFSDWIYSSELGEGLGGYCFSTDKRQVEDMGLGGGSVLGRSQRVLISYRGAPLLPRFGLEGANCQHIYFIINNLPWGPHGLMRWRGRIFCLDFDWKDVLVAPVASLRPERKAKGRCWQWGLGGIFSPSSPTDGDRKGKDWVSLRLWVGGYLGAGQGRCSMGSWEAAEESSTGREAPQCLDRRNQTKTSSWSWFAFFWVLKCGHLHVDLALCVSSSVKCLAFWPIFLLVGPFPTPSILPGEPDLVRILCHLCVHMISWFVPCLLSFFKVPVMN